MSIRLRVTHLLNFLVSCPWMLQDVHSSFLGHSGSLLHDASANSGNSGRGHRDCRLIDIW